MKTNLGNGKTAQDLSLAWISGTLCDLSDADNDDGCPVVMETGVGITNVGEDEEVREVVRGKVSCISRRDTLLFRRVTLRIESSKLSVGGTQLTS